MFMFELWFESKDEADRVAENLSDLAHPERRRKLDTTHEISEYLTLSYEEALEELEELSEEIELDNDPASRLIRALSTTKSLFESGNYEKLIECQSQEEAEDILYDTVDGLAEVKELKERIEETIEEASEVADEGKSPEPDLWEKTSDDFEEYSMQMNFFVSPILDSLTEYANKDDPLEAFTENVYLDVTPISNRFDDLETSIDLESRVIYGLKLDVDHVLHSEEVVKSIEEIEPLNPPEEIAYGLLGMRILITEILSAIRGRKKVGYDEFVREIEERIHTTVRGHEDGRLFPYTDKETVRYVVRKLKRAGFVRRKGNKISEA